MNRVENIDGQLPPASILAALRARGIHSIYLEGGAGILSSFLQAQAIDLLQIHIASMILGAGLPSLRLPAVDHVDDGISGLLVRTVAATPLTCPPPSLLRADSQSNSPVAQHAVLCALADAEDVAASAGHDSSPLKLT